jgi:outer membrane protein assembly factor BamB
MHTHTPSWSRSVQKAIVLSVCTLAGCTGLQVDRPLDPLAGDWLTFGGDNERSNVARAEVKPPLVLEWVNDITGGIGNGSLLIVDSTLIIGNLRGELYAINVNSGKRYGWVDLGEAIQGSPVIDDGIAFIAATNTVESLIAYDLRNGRTRWKKRYGDLEVSPLLYDDRLYFGSLDGTFYCVARDDGSQLWKFEIPDNTKRKGIHSTAAVAHDVVVFGADNGMLYALDARSGDLRWKAQLGESVVAPPAISGHHVFVGDLRGMFHAVDLMTGTIVWSVNDGAAIYACPTVGEGMVVIGTTGGQLIAHRQGDGQRIWTADLESVINSSAVLSGGALYVGTLKKNLYAVDAASGAVVWSTELPGRIKTTPAVAEGRVFVATDNRLVIALRGGAE